MFEIISVETFSFLKIKHVNMSRVGYLHRSEVPCLWLGCLQHSQADVTTKIM